MSLKVYYDLLSQPSRAVVLFIKANKIPFEDKKMNMLKGEHMTKEFAQINPFRKVPAIVHGDFALTESVGILRYLCREFNVPDHWYPKDSKSQAKVDEYLSWQHLNTRLGCATFFFNRFIFPMTSGKPTDPVRLAKEEKKMVEILNLIENTWLGNNKYLAGNAISIADILGACEIEQPKMCGYDPSQGRPKLAAWMERVKNELNPHYDEVHEKVNYVIKKHKGVTPSSPAQF